MADITDKVTTVTTTRSVDPIDATGTVELPGKGIDYQGPDMGGDIAIDKAVEVKYGYEAGGDPEALQLTGQISKITGQATGRKAAEHLTIQVMSLFKNFYSEPISTGRIKNKNGKEILEILTVNLMGWNKHDFTACAATNFAEVRVQDQALPAAMQQIAEACLCELYWEGDGTIKAVAFPDPEALEDWTYDDAFIDDYAYGDQVDIGSVNTLEIIGRERTPDDEDLPTTLIAEQAYNWAGAKVQKVGRFAWVFVPFNYSPVLRPRIEVTQVDPGVSATYTMGQYGDAGVEVQIERPAEDEQEFPDIGWPDYHFTIKVYAYPYQDSQYNKIRKTVQNSTLLAKYNNIIKQQTYENPYIQDDAGLQAVADYRLEKNFYSLFPLEITAPHNPALKPNQIIRAKVIKDGEQKEYKTVARRITTTWRHTGSLKDNITGWILGTGEEE